MQSTLQKIRSKGGLRWGGLRRGPKLREGGRYIRYLECAKMYQIVHFNKYSLLYVGNTRLKLEKTK